jgi:hypothetical protein
MAAKVDHPEISTGWTSPPCDVIGIGFDWTCDVLGSEREQLHWSHGHALTLAAAAAVGIIPNG